MTSQPDLLLDRFAKNCTKQPSKTLFSFISPGLDGGRIQNSYTYDELNNATSALAQRLIAEGLKRGDRYVQVLYVLVFLVAYTAC